MWWYKNITIRREKQAFHSYCFQGGVPWTSLYCKDGQGSNSEAGEVGRGGFQKAKGEVTVGNPLMVPRPSRDGNFSANKRCKVNSALLPIPGNKSQFLCSWFEPLFLSCSPWRNPLPVTPAPNLASAAESFSQWLSQSCSKPFVSPPTSFPKSHRVSWQNQWQALAWLPITPPGLSFPSSFPYSKPSQCLSASATW